MEKIDSVQSIISTTKALRQQKKTIGLVPTMGALHKGHLALIEKAKQENDIVICSIFVNPLQFNKAADLEKYPNTLENDLKLLQSVGCDVVFNPTNTEIYEGYSVQDFDFGNLEFGMEAEFRPGHFNGVANVISRLFDIIEPHRSYYGEKDYQQLAIIRELANRNYENVQIFPCQTVRNEKGLALSSRNFRLNEDQLEKAATLYKCMQFCKQNKQNYSPKELILKATQLLDKDFELEYFIIADELTLQPINNWNDSANPRVFIVAEIVGVRLIDNLSLNQ